MQTLDRRLSELERMTTKQLYNLIIRYDCPGLTGAELWNVEHYSDESPRRVWSRRVDETEKEFTDRAFSEVKRTAFGVALLMQFDLEDRHAHTR